MDDVSRFFKFFKKENCWLWQGSISLSGYGRFYFRQKAHLAHRASYLLFKGEIPSGLDVCHKCDIRNCVNPEHLFLGTRSDNMRDCVNKKRHKPALHNKLKTHCPRNHEYTKENTWINLKGWRWCKKCNLLKATKRNNERTQSKASTKAKAV
jgi:hypothetical protein